MKNFKKVNSVSLKHQWGAEINTAPLSMLHEKPSVLKLTLSRLAIVTTLGFWILYVFSIIIRQLVDLPGNYSFTMEAFSYALVVSFLTFSSLVYLITRHGALERFAKHTRVPRALLDEHFTKNQPAITVLVPSYAEEYQVIRKTLLSAALQEYPKLHIVLLLDDKPNTADPDTVTRLTAERNIGTDIRNYLSEPLGRFTGALKRFGKKTNKKLNLIKETAILAEHYEWAAGWLNNKADEEKITDHVDVFFADQVLRELAKDMETVAKALRMSLKDRQHPAKERLHQLYNRLVWTFRSDVSVFERKIYASLSHEANKAMNLNSYIGLMGGEYRTEHSANGDLLIPTDKKDSKNIVVPDSEFLLTLDADSVLLREYCLRLVYFLQQPENDKVAVTQTPYSSFRGAYSRIERLAGATTDVQHILHQGLTYYDATFWVGANAVIRKAALNDIVEKDLVNGFEVKRFIQDRTVIEDTESSIDLVLHGWKLINYPERLSYSATPPDFGSLVVQRRRWANGGLLILSKLMSHTRERKSRNDIGNRAEFLLRLNYMASIAWATFGLLFLLAYPYDGRLLSPLVLMAALPYFLSMASDLKYNGYSYIDVISIYGFNLIMLPVNLAGVLKSLEQAVTGKKIPFARTPKVKDRTPAGPLYVVAPVFIVLFSVFTVWRNLQIPNYGNAIVAGFNATVATWAIIAYIGFGNLFEDIWLSFKDWLYVDVKPGSRAKDIQPEPEVNWRAVLYHGDMKGSIPHPSVYQKSLS